MISRRILACCSPRLTSGQTETRCVDRLKPWATLSKKAKDAPGIPGSFLVPFLIPKKTSSLLLEIAFGGKADPMFDCQSDFDG